MAEPVGIVLGVLGISGLFTACIENFDIVVRARNFGEEFDLLCTQLSLQRLRLVLWGETLGLVPDPDGKRKPYNSAVDRADIRPAIGSTLNHLRLQLEKADVVTERYKLGDIVSGEPCQALQMSNSTGLKIFSERFEAFTARIRKNQKQKSGWTVTRWSIHDASKFKAIVDNIRDLIDDLESVASTLRVLKDQQSLLVQEIESISDEQSLRLLQDVFSTAEDSRSSRVVSDAASHRLGLLKDSATIEARRSKFTGDSQSYYTAPSQLSELEEQPGNQQDQHRSLHPAWNKWDLKVRPTQDGINIQTAEKPPEAAQKISMEGIKNKTQKLEGKLALVDATPQNQRYMAAVMAKSMSSAPELHFDSGELLYGTLMSKVKTKNDEDWSRRSTSLIVAADQGVSLARRVFLELRSIRNAGVPFISATTIEDSLDKILASIEGPPDTPYEGGIFWISVKYSDSVSPPLLHFETRIYHPNIDCNGNICADYRHWWSDPSLQRYMRSFFEPTRTAWFSEQASNHYSLGALLTALCGLLASPNVQDPLVPEIAETYIIDFPRYYEAAKHYTHKYPTGDRP
ncbi:hypothetical protein GQ53DRAFT_658173, partial [Thozetella sp. PMI_491]